MLPDKKFDKRIKQALGWLSSGMERPVGLMMWSSRESGDEDRVASVPRSDVNPDDVPRDPALRDLG